MKHILINQYFPPDAAPTGLMLELVAKELVDLGHEVTILCAKGRYAGESGDLRDAEPGDKSPPYRIILSLIHI